MVTFHFVFVAPSRNFRNRLINVSIIHYHVTTYSYFRTCIFITVSSISIVITQFVLQVGQFCISNGVIHLNMAYVSMSISFLASALIVYYQFPWFTRFSPLPISAISGSGTGELLDLVCSQLEKMEVKLLVHHAENCFIVKSCVFFFFWNQNRRLILSQTTPRNTIPKHFRISSKYS